VTKRVQVVGGHTGPHVRRDEVENLAGEPSGGAHLLDFVRRFDRTDIVNPCRINAAG
jgi:hypothetical protein